MSAYTSDVYRMPEWNEMHSNILYWLVGTEGSQYYRIGIEPVSMPDEVHVNIEYNIKRQQEYLEKTFAYVEYINEYPMPIGSDIDKYIGLGKKHVIDDGEHIGTVRTCKSLFWRSTKRDNQDKFEWLRHLHKGLLEAVTQAYKTRVEKIKKRQEEKEQGHLQELAENTVK